MSNKPPIGLIPERFHKEERVVEVAEAIIRYLENYIEVPVIWIDEYNKLIKELRGSKLVNIDL